MARIKAHNPQRAKLKASGYMGEPTGEIELTENHRAYNVKAYATANVNVPDPVLIDKNITANGTYQASADEADGYSDVTVALPFEQKEVTPSTTQQDITVTPNTQYQALSKVTVLPAPLEAKTVPATTEQVTYTPEAPAIGFSSVTVEGYVPPAPPVEKDVNFYDYDGTLLYSYTFAEAAQLSALPEPPAHEGLIFQEWNYSLPEVIEYATVNYKCIIGANYTTPNNDTIIHILFLNDAYIEPTLVFSLMNATATIDWSDGTTPDVITETSNTFVEKQVTHTMSIDAYPFTAKIKLSVSSDNNCKFSKQLLANPYSYYVERINVGNIIEGCYAFSNFRHLKAVSLPSWFILSNHVVRYCSSLRFISVPKSTTQIRNFAFDSCTGLYTISLPNSIIYTGFYFIQQTYCKEIVLPRSVIDIASRALQETHALSKLIIPPSVQTIGEIVFAQSTDIKILDMSLYGDNDNFPTLGGSLGTVPTGFTILVANETKKQELSAMTNWSQYADIIEVEGA